MRELLFGLCLRHIVKGPSRLGLGLLVISLAASVALTAAAQIPPPRPGDAQPQMPPVESRFATPPKVDPVPITSDMSLVHVGSNDSFAITKEGHQAVELLYKALTEGDTDAAREAIGIYDTIIPRENYGGNTRHCNSSPVT